MSDFRATYSVLGRPSRGSDQISTDPGYLASSDSSDAIEDVNQPRESSVVIEASTIGSRQVLDAPGPGILPCVPGPPAGSGRAPSRQSCLDSSFGSGLKIGATAAVIILLGVFVSLLCLSIIFPDTFKFDLNDFLDGSKGNRTFTPMNSTDV